jgi:hypothetical protein
MIIANPVVKKFSPTRKPIITKDAPGMPLISKNANTDGEYC